MNRPREVAVVGAGVVGLATAWFLQQRGVSVTVYDRDRVAAGASWGNAGWLTPAIATPLPEPAVLRYGLRTALMPSSPVYVPPRADPQLWRFLVGFARHCTNRRWKRAMAAYAPLNRIALDAFDELGEGGAVPRPREAAPFLVGFSSDAARAAMVAELEHIRQVQPVDFDLVTGDRARKLEPALSSRIRAAIRLQGQRYVNPPEFVHALADAVVGNGGKLHQASRVRRVRELGSCVLVETGPRLVQRYDAVVLATGAALGDLAADFGVRRQVQAGRGYSFSVESRYLPAGPLYFPAERIACTPLDTPTGPRLRVAGMMEFRGADEPLDPRRIKAIVDATGRLIAGADLDRRHDEWVGSRPCTTDGLPLIGATSSSRVHVAGGHGMWGVTLGPVTGKLLAEQIVTGTRPAALAPFDPTR
ncbi:NAD(P)/FAD-dependent oxidoreductase [Nocardioides sp.]|uniref:NAD(P)/FAD-dependent oxidoreductase n=1 Tax=Nocardioides sp. TaxID=35761 RepID=UPI002ED1421C